MLTATKDLMLPATVTGSWPRPRWYDGGLWGRPLDTALLDVSFREQFLDAHATVIADQERAGLDILTNGDYHLDEDFAGRSWHHYPFQRWTGLEHEELQYERSRDRLLEFAPGTLMNEIETTWRWPRVVGKVEHDPRNPLEYAKLWRIAQARAASGKPVKFGTCSSQVLSIFLDSHTSEYDLEDKKQLIWDMATAMNTELRQLAAAGAKVIQIEEPTIHFVANFYPDQKDLLDFLVDAFNHEVDGLDDVELWIHTCWGNPNMQKVYTGESYEPSIDIYLDRLKGDVWTVEATENELAEIDLFKPYAGTLKKKVAVGIVNHRTLQADMPPVVAKRVRRALEVIPADKLILSTRLRVRPARVQPDGRVLQDDGDRAGSQHRPQGARPRGALRRRGRPVAPDGRAPGPRAADAPAVTLAIARDSGGHGEAVRRRRQGGVARPRPTTMSSSSGCRARYCWTYGQVAMTRSSRRRASSSAKRTSADPHAPALVGRQHLRMDEGDPPAFDDVFEDARELTVEIGFIAVAGRRIRDHRAGWRGRHGHHARGGRSTRHRPPVRPSITRGRRRIPRRVYGRRAG